MKKLKGFLVLAAVLQFFLISPAPAAILVDTGATPPPPEGSSTGYSIYGNNYGQHQWLAGQFVLSQLATITSVQGWLKVTDPGTLNFVIYSDVEGLPGSVLYSQPFNMMSNLTQTPDWYGPSGLNWSLNAGTYWVAFEAPDVPYPNFYGYMPYPAPNPLGKYAVYGKDTYNDPPYDPGYLRQDALDLGVRINGDVNAPATLIVDTGTSNDQPGVNGDWGGIFNYDQGNFHFIAGRFTTNRDYIVTSVQGWMDTESTGNLTIAILNNDTSTGLPGSTRFSQNFPVSACNGASWKGITGLHWFLPAGTYWVAFEAPSGSTFLGYLNRNAPNPLAKYAQYDDVPHGWDPSGGGICVQVGAKAAYKPLTGILLLMD